MSEQSELFPMNDQAMNEDYNSPEFKKETLELYEELLYSTPNKPKPSTFVLTCPSSIASLQSPEQPEPERLLSLEKRLELWSREGIASHSALQLEKLLAASRMLQGSTPSQSIASWSFQSRMSTTKRQESHLTLVYQNGIKITLSTST
jgi:hypothetical protein